MACLDALTQEQKLKSEVVDDHPLPQVAVPPTLSKGLLWVKCLFETWEAYRLSVWSFAKWYFLIMILSCSTVFCYHITVVSTKVAESALETAANTAAQYVGVSVGKFTVSKVLGSTHDTFSMLGEKSLCLAFGALQASLALLF
jgi:hypothetical protein